ncbi:MAG: cytochrome c biogenesis protein CcsA, partial [Telluria sp.]
MEISQTQTYTQTPGYFKRLGALDWLFAVALMAGALYGLATYGAYMDVYEKAILLLAAPTFAVVGWHWKPLRWLMPVVALLALGAIGLYGGDLLNAEKKFFLKYMLSSQSAILWMSALFVFSTVFYWVGLLSRSDFGTSVGSRLCWAAVVLGWTGMMVRWFESYLIGADVGHIPVSNLYEVFILFSLITAMFYLHYETHYATRQLGAFVMLIISAAVVFLLWYTVSRDAAGIEPLVPALQSWWMKIHVPANFIGYGTFAIAAMVAFAYLIKQQADETRWWKLAPLWALGVVLCFEPLVFRKAPEGGMSNYWAIYFGVSALIVGTILLLRKRIAARLPGFEILDDVMYKAIAVGFAFFTIATILGAFWAAEAWGGYWSWDPKETWALIVW